MQASDIMTTTVVSAPPEMAVQDLARLLLEKGISAVPVIGDGGELIGMVSEGDLIRRVETGTDKPAASWLDLFASMSTVQERFIKSHGQRAEDVMTKEPVSVAPDASLTEIAGLLESRRIKRVPVVEDGSVVGIVSRANLLHALAVASPSGPVSQDDRSLRAEILKRMAEAGGGDGSYVNVIVTDGVAQLMGAVFSDRNAHALVTAVESVPGVKKVENKLGRLPAWVYGY